MIQIMTHPHPQFSQCSLGQIGEFKKRRGLDLWDSLIVCKVAISASAGGLGSRRGSNTFEIIDEFNSYSRAIRIIAGRRNFTLGILQDASYGEGINLRFVFLCVSRPNMSSTFVPEPSFPSQLHFLLCSTNHCRLFRLCHCQSGE